MVKQNTETLKQKREIQINEWQTDSQNSSKRLINQPKTRELIKPAQIHHPLPFKGYFYVSVFFFLLIRTFNMRNKGASNCYFITRVLRGTLGVRERARVFSFCSLLILFINKKKKEFFSLVLKFSLICLEYSHPSLSVHLFLQLFCFNCNCRLFRVFVIGIISLIILLIPFMVVANELVAVDFCVEITLTALLLLLLR